MLTMKTLLPAATIATMTLIAAPTMASTINVSKVDSSTFGDENGDDQWKIITSYAVDDVQQGAVYAGAFRLESDAPGSLSAFLAFCLQPLENLTLPKAHHVGSLFDASVTEKLNILAQNSWDLVTDSISAGAFQLAAWELATEDTGVYDIDDGHFKITYNSDASNDAEAQAQIWLDNITNDVWTDNGEEFVILNAEGTQDLLTNVAAVPLPASGLLLLGGLFGAGAVARRKARKA